MLMVDEQYIYNLGYADGYTEDGVSVPMKDFREPEILMHSEYKKGYEDGKKAKEALMFPYIVSDSAKSVEGWDG